MRNFSLNDTGEFRIVPLDKSARIERRIFCQCRLQQVTYKKSDHAGGHFIEKSFYASILKWCAFFMVEMEPR